ncbi:MAG: DUF2061 domain-containing protein [Candidatus Helarchaeota archaeon]|nr:DUF2061 domain-containing protein [Candidatus Helarchaeota archaeon]
MDVKRNLAKSLVYRAITIGFGLLTAYIVTGDIFTAFLVSILTEVVQFFWYFSFDTVWTYYDEKRLRKLIGEEFRQKEIKLKLSLESITDIAREFSQVDTFIPKVYNSVLSFYNKILLNKELKELHDDFLEYKNAFETIHKGRELAES